MRIPSNSSPEKKSQLKATENNQKSKGGVEAAPFMDKRSEAIAQLKLQELANNSHRNKQIAQLQSSLSNSNAEDPIQLARQEYKTVAKKPPGFNKNNWPAALSNGGGDADSSISQKVNETLKDMGWGGKVKLMSAHMIPNRLGGKGNNSNVRPWPDTFEKGIWETEMESKFNDELDKINDGEELQYKVITNDLEDAEATKVLTDADYKVGDPNFDTHKNRLKKIPKDVEGVIGGKSIGVYDQTWPIK
ncbi:MAG: hypothetical protein NWR83_11750 [Salibacteraceae bacterium]|nr:hypothetical protein [Salibacteraceae bacterium]